MQNRISTEKTPTACAYCGAPGADAHFCAECRRLQPLAAATDYFAFLGLPRKLRLDEQALEKTFYALSRQFHPDYFMNASADEQQASLDRSSRLNEAYRTLRDPIARTKYLLTSEGYKEAEKKAPPDLLEEVFELNMQIEELKAAQKMGDDEEISAARPALAEALANLNERMSELDQQLVTLFDRWDAAYDNGRLKDEKKAILDQMSELLSHRSYLRNLVRDVTAVME